MTGSASSHLALQMAAAASRERKWLAHRAALDAHADADEGDGRDHEQFRKNRAGEQAVERSLRIHAVKDGRNAGGKQQAERAGSREQPDGKVFGIAGFDQHRHQQAAERKDGEAGAGEREDRADGDGGDGEAAGNPAKERGEDAQQPLGCSALHHEISGQREERDGRQQRRRHQAVHFHGHGCDGRAAAPEEQERQAAEDGEDRQSEHGGEGEQRRARAEECRGFPLGST